MVEARELWVELMARLAHTLSIDLGGARDPPVAVTPQPVRGCNLASASEPVLNQHQRTPK